MSLAFVTKALTMWQPVVVHCGYTYIIINFLFICMMTKK